MCHNMCIHRLGVFVEYTDVCLSLLDVFVLGWEGECRLCLCLHCSIQVKLHQELTMATKVEGVRVS